MRRLLFILAALGMMSSPVLSADLGSPSVTVTKAYNHTGCGVSVAGAYDVHESDHELGIVGAPVTVGLDSLSASGNSLGLGADCVVQIPGAPVFAGLGGNYWFADDQEFTADLTAPGFNASAIYGFGDMWEIYAKVGMVVKGALASVKAGYAEVEGKDVNVTATGGFAMSFDMPDREGWLLGGEVELPLTGNVAVFGGYTHYWWDDSSVTFGGVVTDDLDEQSGKAFVGVKVKLGGFVK